MITICKEKGYCCPCLNLDYEQGEECNLGYSVEYRMSLADHHNNAHFIVSNNCGLIKIHLVTGTIKPRKNAKI